LIGDATGLSAFERLTASEHLAAAFHARRMAPSEADQRCIDETGAMFDPNSDEDGNVTESKLQIAQTEAIVLCDGYSIEYSSRNVTTGEGTANETTIPVLETGHVELDLVGCDHVPLWEEECNNASGFGGSVPDLDTRCLINDDAPPGLAGAIITSSLRNVYDCFAASCESTVQKLQSGMFDDILGLPLLAGTIAALPSARLHWLMIKSLMTQPPAAPSRWPPILFAWAASSFHLSHW